jgi:hypothetical protein
MSSRSRRRVPVALTLSVALAAVALSVPPSGAAAPNAYPPSFSYVSGGDYTFGSVGVVGIRLNITSLAEGETLPTADEVVLVSEPAGLEASAIEAMSAAESQTLFYRLSAPPGDYEVRVFVRGQSTDCVAYLTFGAAAEPAVLLVTDRSLQYSRSIMENTQIPAPYDFYLAYFAADGTPVSGLGAADIALSLDPSAPVSAEAPSEIAPGVYKIEAGVWTESPDAEWYYATATLPGGVRASVSIQVQWLDRRCTNLVLSQSTSRQVAVGDLLEVEVYLVDDACQGVSGLDKAYFAARTFVSFEVVSVQADQDLVGGYDVTFRAVARAPSGGLLPLDLTAEFEVTGDAPGAPVADTLFWTGTEPRYGEAGLLPLSFTYPANPGGAPSTPGDVALLFNSADVRATVIPELEHFSSYQAVALLIAPPGTYAGAATIAGVTGLGPRFEVEFGAEDKAGQSIAKLLVDRLDPASAVAHGGTTYSTRLRFRLAYYSADGTPITGLTGDDIRFTFRPTPSGDVQGPVYSRGATTEIAPGIYEFPVDVSVYETESFKPTVTLPDGTTTFDFVTVSRKDLSCRSAVLKEPYGLPQEVEPDVAVWYHVYVVDRSCQGVSGLEQADFAAQAGPGIEVIYASESASSPGRYEVGVRAATAGQHTVLPDLDDTYLVVTGPADEGDDIFTILRAIVEIIRDLIERLLAILT